MSEENFLGYVVQQNDEDKELFLIVEKYTDSNNGLTYWRERNLSGGQSTSWNTGSLKAAINNERELFTCIGRYDLMEILFGVDDD